jgi:hypothetical protein
MLWLYNIVLLWKNYSVIYSPFPGLPLRDQKQIIQGGGEGKEKETQNKKASGSIKNRRL